MTDDLDDLALLQAWLWGFRIVKHEPSAAWPLDVARVVYHSNNAAEDEWACVPNDEIKLRGGIEAALRHMLANE